MQFCSRAELLPQGKAAGVFGEGGACQKFTDVRHLERLCIFRQAENLFQARVRGGDPACFVKDGHAIGDVFEYAFEQQVAPFQLPVAAIEPQRVGTKDTEGLQKLVNLIHAAAGPRQRGAAIPSGEPLHRGGNGPDISGDIT